MMVAAKRSDAVENRCGREYRGGVAKKILVC